MMNKKSLLNKNKFFLVVFLFSLFKLLLGAGIKIGNEAYLDSKFYENISNETEVFIIYEKSDLEILNSWERKDNGMVILYFNINNKNFRKISDLKFKGNFQNKFKIIKSDSYWIGFNSVTKKKFDKSGNIEDEIAKIKIKDNEILFSTKDDNKFSGNSILAICLEPKYKKYPNEIYKHITEYSYKDSHNKNVSKITYSPDFYFINEEDSELKIERYQSLDIDRDKKMDFSYQKNELTGENGDIIFYKIKITNESSESVFNLKIINLIAEYTKMSYGDKGFNGTGYPIIKLEDGKVIPIESYPQEGYGGNLETYFKELKPKEKIYIYYCVEIVR